VTGFRILVADDEPLARAMVAGMLRDDPEIGTVVECGDATEVRGAIDRLRADIVFLDVEMPEVDGIQIAGDLEAEDPVVVFVTAFSNYATNAFDVRAVDYVLKPFTDERFREAVARAKARVRERRSRDAIAEPSRPGQYLPGQYLDRLMFKEADRPFVVQVVDIVWIEAQDYYALVHTPGGRHLVRATLASLEAKLDPRCFARVHRGAIVNVAHVTDVRDRHRMHVTLSTGAVIAVSRARRRSLEALRRVRLRPEQSRT
jgi:two-component system LytT family response regulator